MKLEEGMYVRTNIGIIDIIRTDLIGFDEAVGEKNVFCEKHIIEKSRIVKANHNIIDLIEVGDYINGYLVEDITSVYDNGEEIITLHIASGSNYFQSNINDKKEIKSIVTKEKFENMSYKVERVED